MFAKTLQLAIHASVTILFVVGTLSLAIPNTTPAYAASFSDLEQQQAGGSVSFKDFVRTFYAYLSRFVLVVALLSGTWGGYLYMYSGGDPGKLKVAKEIIYSAITGIVAVAFAYVFFDILNPESLSSIR